MDLLGEIPDKGAKFALSSAWLGQNSYICVSKINRMYSSIPKYLTELKTNIKILAFVLLFSLLFISIYNPLEVSEWLKTAGSTGRKFAFSSIVILGGITVIFISRLILIPVHKRHPLNITQYCFWLAGEVVIIALAYGLLVKCGMGDARTFIEVFRGAVVCTLMLLAIPYTVSYLYLALREKDKKIKELLFELEKYKPSSEGTTETSSHATLQTTATENHIRFYDEKGILRLTIQRDYLYYIESADNYVKVHYKKGDKMGSELIRITLKNLEESLQPYGFTRCHRSYLINTKKIKIIRKGKEGFFIDFDLDGVGDIPVSKTYADQVTRLFS